MVSVVKLLAYSQLLTIYFFFFDLWYDLPVSPSILLLVFASLSFVFYLILKGHFTLAKYTFTVTASLGHFFSASTQGPDVGNILLYFPFMCSLFLCFDIKKKLDIALLCAFLLLQMFFLEYTRYQLLGLPHSITVDYQKYSYYSLLFASMFLCMRFIKELSIINRASQTKLVILNKRLRKNNERLQKTNEELDTFVYKASHDMRSPLRSILGLTHLLGLEKDPAKIPQYLHLLERSAFKLDAYVIDILEMSRNSKSDIEIQRIDLESFIWEIYGKLEYMTPDRKVDFGIECRGTEFFSDRSRLRVVLSNIIGNSLKYSKKEQGKIQLLVNISEKEAVITLEDNGQGIAKESLPKVFDMFYRATESSDGSGLGLYIVKETLLKLGGSIYISSVLGEGTKVKVLVPNTTALVGVLYETV